MANPPLLTDRAALTAHRARATQSFLHDTARAEVEDRLAMVNRAFTAPVIVTGSAAAWVGLLPGARLIADDDTLALTEGSADLVIHAMSLHWANDPVGQVIQCARALRPDGMFLCLSLGGQTLHELRAALASAETEVTGGLSPRVLPMADIRDMGALLQRAGLALPVADALRLSVTYASALHLMRDLRAMGEGNALAARLRPLGVRTTGDLAALPPAVAWAAATGDVSLNAWLLVAIIFVWTPAH
jgi:SAM-dependent methyltransferase